MTECIISIVVTTLGGSRMVNLTRLLDSLQNQRDKRFEVVVSYQGVGEFVLPKTYSFPMTILNNAGGASRGRNLGSLATSKSSGFLTFPNDTTWYEPGFVSYVAGKAKFDSIVLETLESSGPRYSLRSKSGKFDSGNVWSVLEPMVIVKRATFIDQLGLDESLGTGSYSPWQNAAIADFLIRASDSFPNVLWDSTSRLVNGVSQSYELSESQKNEKLARYGVGYLFVRNRIGQSLFSNFCSVLYPFISRRRSGYKAKYSEFVGRFKGLVGSLLVGNRGYRALPLLPVFDLDVQKKRLLLIDIRSTRVTNPEPGLMTLGDLEPIFLQDSDVFLFANEKSKTDLLDTRGMVSQGVIMFCCRNPEVYKLDVASLLAIYEQVDFLSAGKHRALKTTTFSRNSLFNNLKSDSKGSRDSLVDETFICFEKGNANLLTIASRIPFGPDSVSSGSIHVGSKDESGLFLSLMMGARRTGSKTKAIPFSARVIADSGLSAAICYLRGAALAKLFPGYKI